MSPFSDKNLLFALIAYQNGYITMEQFFEAATVWNKEPLRELGEILVEKKFLEEVERFNIQGIVEDRLRRQGGIDNTLSFVLENGSVPEGQPLPEDWKGKIDAITKVIRDKNPPSPPSFSTPEANPGIHRYIIRKTLGHGGQGYVWEAIDTELNRRVAIKNIVPDLSSDPLHQELLIDEARKTGKLGHPGVPPVFDIGKDDEGKPFFTMQLISGEKLSERYKTLKHESISQSDFVNQIRPVLRHLIAACNTVEFAFDNEAVIHRDLKPDNIMVNRHGETVVMDWGMGKIITDPSQLPDQASSVLLIPMSPGSGSQERTSVGTIKGTVTYMSPEQARAENDRLDHRTDVYGLGAILYWILTGQAPHTKKALPDIQKNRFPAPSQVRPTLSIPRELEAICLKAMASQPEDRYQKGGDMAADLENFIAGEPVVALPENFVRKSERFLRKHARAVIASLLGLTLAVLGLTLANVIISGQKKEIERQNRKLVENEEELNSQLEKIQKLVKDLTASRRVASATLEEVVGSLFDDRLSQVPGANEVRIGLLTDIATKIETYLVDNPDDTELKLDLVRLLTRLAKLEGENNKTQEATKHWQRADELLKETKDTPDQVFQINWKKTFCDNSYYQTSALLKQGLVDQADALVKEACSIADQYQDSLKGDIKELQKFAPAYARLYRRRASILARRENWAQALDETIKARGLLQKYVVKHLPKLASEPESTEIIPNVDAGTLGYYILLCGDQGDYETIMHKYSDAANSYLEALEACKLAPKAPSLEKDGRVKTATNLRKLHRLALMVKDYSKADFYYQQAIEICSLYRSIESEFEQNLIFIESDRARGLAETNLAEARRSLERAENSLESIIKNGSDSEVQKIVANASTMAEIRHSFAAAKVIFEKSSGNPEKLQSLEETKKEILKELKELNSSPLRIMELNFLP
jgi:serine/threonine protein kinase